MVLTGVQISSKTDAALRFQRAGLFWLGWALVALGVVAIIAPQLGNIVIGVLTGWLLWLSGALTLGGTLLLQGFARGWAGILSSLAAIAAGLFLLTHPTVGAYALGLVVTSVFLIDGTFQLALSLGLRPLKVWRWVLASAMASLLAALAVGANLATDRASAMGLIIGVAVFTTGAAFVALSTTRRRRLASGQGGATLARL